MFSFLTMIRALSDENRVRMLMALREREMCVCQITAFLDLAPSTTSKHLTILRQARLIDGRKRGKWVYYSLPGDRAPDVVREALAWLTKELADNPVVAADHRRIQELLREPGAVEGAAEEAGAPEGHSKEIHRLAKAEEDSV